MVHTLALGPPADFWHYASWLRGMLCPLLRHSSAACAQAPQVRGAVVTRLTTLRRIVWYSAGPY